MAEDDWNAERARVTYELVAGVRGLAASEVPEALGRACLALLPVASGLSVSVLGDGADLGVVLCASDAVAARLAEIQYTLGEGPGMEAVRLRAPVFATDLTRPPADRRWPLFSVLAAKAGAKAAFSLPLAVGAGALGTLDLYRETSGSLSDAQVRTALLVADAVALAVIALDHTYADPEGDVTWLAGAETDREEVHQATGMIMFRLGVDAEEALLRLRARAFAEGRTSAEVALGVIDGTLDLGDD
ncbi:GAF and ANTAR domain-containing protein [Streptomyces acidiscabies]|uniref:GAF and ANTAR domain-containing protein n=1 Tax=Streptomyces acidiscabies TaxID=42234 RepID=A0AAP6EJ33_9ACTN|nr:GAF and ANTAR domain-containing protein [Streptomyces acidiscabies]MBZ3913906.1 GAF and ANTAR domain-containing protein [Streptomyces acidiscabies]MDX2964533.1 GAF and ANTAR domain-containing protein [Streptomyces acidiscabies]MDX3022003.1 GAF and ANTAR domain-containing protein [Streptomyces acidiscabies]MDX3793567.1 GAF and ANTAR domain-containing protein [Streptomyces acidiscabies]GAQ56963.1 ANTAR domain protein [Streptomyces acidiscabies]